MLLRILNPVIFILFTVQILTGLFHESIPEDLFEIFHEANGILIGVLVLFHLFLNRKWIANTYFKKKSK